MKWQPTHKITFRPAAGGKTETYRVRLEDGAAYSRAEYAAYANAWIERTEAGEWLFGGEASPNRANGTVTVVPLKPAEGVSQ